MDHARAAAFHPWAALARGKRAALRASRPRSRTAAFIAANRAHIHPLRRAVHRCMNSLAVDPAAFARQPLPEWALRTISYMSDIEHHTIAYLRELLGTRAVDDPEVAEFLARWFYEESAHGRALAAVLDASGFPASPSPRRPRGLRARAEAMAIAALSATWREFPALHMTWGAINELTTLTAYRRLAARAGHPALAELLTRIARDESRHFGFYFDQAARRLADSPRTRRLVRAFVARFWAPVGSGVRSNDEVRFLGAALFDGADGRDAARRIDRTIRRLPGCRDLPLVDAWLDRHLLRAAQVPAALEPIR